MPRIFFRALLLGVLAVLAACSSPPQIADSTSAAGSETSVVVPGAPVPDSAARTLSAKFAAVGWGDLPGWSNDDLRGVWTTFMRNCAGLMRPTAVNLAGPTRATPRAWQAV